MATAGPRPRRLELRLGIPDVGGRPDVYPVVTMLIDPWALGEHWEFGWVEPRDDDGFAVTLWDVDFRHGIVVGLTPGPGSPADLPRSMADYLVSAPGAQWPVISTLSRGEVP